MKLLFLHGWQSTPGGLKLTYLNDHGHEVLNPVLPKDDFDAAVRIAQADFDQHQPDVVVGSICRSRLEREPLSRPLGASSAVARWDAK